MNRNAFGLLAILVIASLVLAACPAPAPAPAAAPAKQEQAAAPAAAPANADCAPAKDGPLAGVDRSGQKIVWWHNHTKAREEGL